MLKGGFIMKKGTVKLLSVLAAVLVIVIVVISAFVSGYNTLVEKQEALESAQAQVSTQLQRRADLIPNFVATVKGYSEYEQSTYTAVTEARAAVSNADSVADQQKASEDLDKAIDIWVNAVTEAYPELKADTQYTALTDELAGTENRIATARKDYNELAQEYNTSIRKFPRNILASMFGFEKAEYFENDASASDVPQVSFD